MILLSHYVITTTTTTSFIMHNAYKSIAETNRVFISCKFAAILWLLLLLLLLFTFLLKSQLFIWFSKCKDH